MRKTNLKLCRRAHLGSAGDETGLPGQQQFVYLLFSRTGILLLTFPEKMLSELPLSFSGKAIIWPKCLGINLNGYLIVLL